jgi:hypothetical protein
MPVILKPDSISSQIADLERRLRIMENTQRTTAAVTQAGWGVNLYKMRVYASGGQSFADGTTAIIAFPNVSFDNSSGYNTGTNQWTVPLSGWYDVKVVCQLSPPANGAGVYTMGPLTLKRVGDANAVSESDPLSLYAPAGLGSNGACIPIVDTVHLAKGDVVYATVTTVNAGAGTWFISGTTPPAAYITFWTMQLIST